MSKPIPPSHAMNDGEEFLFLNFTHRFPGKIDWYCPAVSKLWRYNLHYFDYALDPCRPTEWVEMVIADWIEQNPPGESDGWEPYPVSLRVVNWIKFALTRCPREGLGEKVWLFSLYQQLAWLERNIEKEILANHVLKNAKALIMGGAFFGGIAADRWLKKGLRLLLREVEEQFLPDGGHYERSLMYHSISVEDLIDVLNLFIASPGIHPEPAIDFLTEKSFTGLNFLEHLCYPDGNIPLFNDAAINVAPKTTALSAYGARILGYQPLEKDVPAQLIEKPFTGYFGYRSGGEVLLIDAGPLGPPYQPGHGHCDMLSFELVLDNQRIIVDSGVFSYDNDVLRRTLRGTAAHNTVRLDGEEQSDIWGSFRVGRRARPEGIGIDAQLPDRFQFRASHNGYRHLPGRPIHQRVFDCEIGSRWAIADRINGRGRHRIESFLHIHPEIQVDANREALTLSNSAGTLLCQIRVIGGNISLIPSVYCPEFGIQIPAQTICLFLEAELPADLGYSIVRV